MAKQLNVNLAFTADTSQAKAQLQALQASLTQLTSTSAISKSGLGIDKEIASATTNVNKLKVALEQATNTKTGKLDLGMFDAQLKKSGLKLQDYAESLYALGPKGAQAFSQLAQSITTAEIPLRRSNTLLTEFATTLKNTARWQISSSILHGFMGSVQSAYGYAKDLNESLNNIRIVTGQNTDQMAKFAKEANKAAKALSTTTTEYTNASLIYYQQGLSEQEVKDRTDITIKMANAAGQSAEIVSDQLTAVWNNYYDGSKSLEYYADVMTALGAATASSTSEIADGLQKFSAIANTVGLSYEYATAALATVTATSRESADVVGTAFKTLFARIQDLELGKTLDDGTTLGSYAEGLAKVGISIKDANGELKGMDSILNEMGEKWKDLNDDERVALAQKVAGVRQYNQLMTLMENWDYFQENLGVVGSAEGTLQVQADIYAESWEAAANRVKASLETIYGQLLDDEFFIDLNNGLANVLDTISDLIDKTGGLKGVLLILSTVLMRTFGDSLAKEIERISFNLTMMGNNAHKTSEKVRNEMNNALKSFQNDKTIVGTAQYTIMQQQGDLQGQLIAKNKELLSQGKSMTEEEQKQIGLMMDLNKATGDQIIKNAEVRKEVEETTKSLASRMNQQNRSRGVVITGDQVSSYVQNQSAYIASSSIAEDLQQFKGGETTVQNLKSRLESLKSSLANVDSKFDGVSQSIQYVNDALNMLGTDDDKIIKDLEIDLTELDSILDGLKSSAETFGGVVETEFMQMEAAAENSGASAKEVTKILQEAKQIANQSGAAVKTGTELQQRYGLQVKETNKQIGELHGRTYTAADGFVALGSTISQVAMTATIFKSTLDTFNSEDATWLDKLTSGAMLLGTTISTLTFVLGKSNREQLAAIPISLAAALGFKAEEVAAKGATTGVISFGAALKFLATNPYVWAVTAIIAGIAAVCIALYKSTHKAQKAFKILEKGAKDATTSMQEIKTEVEGLSSALDSLSEKTKALDDLTYGTSQWASAMADVNEEVLDLIDNYNLNEFNAEGLANYYRDDRGVMHLTDAGRLEISNKAEAKVETANKAMNATEYARNKGEAAARRENLINGGYTGKSSNSKYQTQYTSRSVSSGTVNTEQRPNHSSRPNSVSSYSSSPYQTTLSAKGIDDTVQALQQGLISKDLLGDANALIEAGVSKAQAELISSNKFLQDELYNLSIATKENTEAYEAKVANELINNDAVYESIYGTTNSEGQQVGGIDEKYRDSAMSQISKDIIKLEEQYLKDIKPEDIEEQRNEYAEAFDYGEKDGKYYKKDEHGNILTDQEVTISDDAVKQWIAHNKAIEAVTKNVDKYTGAVETSNKVWESAAKLKEKTGKEELSLWEKTKNVINEYKNNFKNMDEESAQIVQETTNHLQQMLRISDDVVEDILTPEFIQENSALIEDAINGDIEALNALSTKAAEGIGIETYINPSGEQLTAEAKEMLAEVDSQIDDIEIGASLNDTEVVKTLNSMLEKGQITSEQMKKYLGLKGFKGAKIGLKPVTRSITIFEKIQSLLSGKGWPAADSETYQVPYIIGSDQTQPNYDPGGNTRSSQPLGTSPILKPKDPSKIIDTEDKPPRGGDDEDNGNKYKPEEDRYHRITKEIEKQERALKRLQTAKDNAFGANKLKLINDEITALENLKTANEELYSQQQEKLNQDAAAVLELFPEADFSQGYLSNYNELLMQTTSEEQKKILDQYVKTWDDINNTYDKIIDFDNQIKDRKYEDLNYKLELEIDIDDSELKLLELQLSQYEDSFYHLAESVALMSSQGELYKDTLELYKDHWDSLKEKFENQDITQEKYIEGLKNTRDGIYDQLEALIDLDKEMLHFYEDTLASADDEVDKFISKMEHLTDVFDHYLNLMDILGKSKDYEVMGDFLGGKADTIKDRLDSASAYYDELLEQKAEIEAKLNKAIEDEDKAAIELYQKEWDAIVESTNKAEDEVLSLTEEWAEAMKAVVENEMNSLADTLEKSLTKGLGFETLMDNFDKLNTYQEEFLTKTNQMYETSKLMRTANKALDATDNKVAKEKLKNFINETEALQNNTRLSKTELEIQQAKYDLLLAEIALEEAQNAKSTVRLSRDNEGNFGYVYTADENKIADAEQGVADADNKLYNLSLEKQQEYTQKYLQAQQQMYDEMTQLHQDYINELITEDEYKLRLQGIQEYYYGSAEYNTALEELNRQYHSGQIASEEEYNRKKAELLEKYQGQEGILTVYSSQYNDAVSAHAAAAQDNWQTEYGEMTTNTSDWKIAVNKYLEEVQGQTELWKSTSVTANSLVKGALNDSETATKNLKEESSKLKDKLNDEVIPAVGNQLTKVGELTKAYGEQRTELQLLITKYSGYITKLNEAITAASRLASAGGNVETPAPAVTNPTPSGTGSSGGGGSGDTGTTPVTPGPKTDPFNPDSPESEPPESTGQKKWMYMLVLKMDSNAYAYKSGYVYSTSSAAIKAGDTKAAIAGISESVIVQTYQEGETNLPSKNVGMPKGKIGGTMSGENWSNNPYLQESNGYFVQKSALLYAHGFANEKIGKIVYGANVGQGMWLYSSTGLPTHFFNANQIKEFDTGGYTGKWGPEGKLAMLHQKELVLNADDTENMLEIVSAVRAIMDSIDVQASWASNGLGMLTAAGYNSMSQNLEQTVTIHAEFPNATNHSEIEEAFNTLINRASQYANRK